MQKFCIFGLIGFFLLCSIRVYAAWEFALIYSSSSSAGAVVSAQAILGEHAEASEAWDWNHDFPLGPPPMASSYVRVYFSHSDWGVNNGNYFKDIRSANPAQKTWAISLQNYNPPGNNYQLAWSIPAALPAYYAPKLLIGSRTIDMRAQNSHSFTTITSTCTIRMDFNPGMPYLIEAIPQQDFTNNLPQSLYLQDYFGVISGNLSFSYSANEHVNQSLQTTGEGTFWIIQPIPGWQGNTTVSLTATGSSGSTSCFVQINRDSTNTSPEIQLPIPAIEIVQNQRSTLTWEDVFFDADLDPIAVQIFAPPGFQVQDVPDSLYAWIIPPLGYKGNDSLQVSASDGVNEPVVMSVPISVIPSEPLPPVGLTITKEPSGAILVVWQDVNQDVSGANLTGLQYLVKIYSDAACTDVLQQYYTDEAQIELPETHPKAFIKVISIND